MASNHLIQYSFELKCKYFSIHPHQFYVIFSSIVTDEESPCAYSPHPHKTLSVWCVRVCVYVCLCECMCVLVCVCWYVYVCACMCVLACACVYVRVHVCVLACVHVCAGIHVCACVCACMHMCVHVCTCVHVCIQAWTLTSRTNGQGRPAINVLIFVPQGIRGDSVGGVIGIIGHVHVLVRYLGWGKGCGLEGSQWSSLGGARRWKLGRGLRGARRWGLEGFFGGRQKSVFGE